MSNEINWYIFYTTIMFIPFIMRWLIPKKGATSINYDIEIRTLEAQIKDMSKTFLRTNIPKLCKYCGGRRKKIDKFCQYCGVSFELKEEGFEKCAEVY